APDRACPRPPPPPDAGRRASRRAGALAECAPRWGGVLAEWTTDAAQVQGGRSSRGRESEPIRPDPVVAMPHGAMRRRTGRREGRPTRLPAVSGRAAWGCPARLPGAPGPECWVTIR